MEKYLADKKIFFFLHIFLRSGRISYRAQKRWPEYGHLQSEHILRELKLRLSVVVAGFPLEWKWHGDGDAGYR